MLFIRQMSWLLFILQKSKWMEAKIRGDSFSLLSDAPHQLGLAFSREEEEGDEKKTNDNRKWEKVLFGIYIFQQSQSYKNCQMALVLRRREKRIYYAKKKLLKNLRILYQNTSTAPSSYTYDQRRRKMCFAHVASTRWRKK